jgi:hypothetical protein
MAIILLTGISFSMGAAFGIVLAACIGAYLYWVK